MFDWPEQSQTSPMRRLPTVTTLSPVIFIVNGPPALSGISSTRHLPSVAVVLSFWSPISTVTFSPSRAVPQTGSGWSRCSTAPSVNSGLGMTSARRELAKMAAIAVISELGINRLFMGFPKRMVLLIIHATGIQPADR